VAKTFQSSGNIAGHGEFDRVCGVVPVEVEAAELCAGPINGDGVVTTEGGDEKVSSGLANILDAKVIDNESKHDWFGGVDKDVGQSDLSIPVPQELHSQERSSAPRTDSTTSTEALVE